MATFVALVHRHAMILRGLLTAAILLVAGSTEGQAQPAAPDSTWRDGPLASGSLGGSVPRFGGRHLYRIVAIGFANSTWKNGHGSCATVPCQYRYDGRGFAYDLGIHATRMLGGAALNISGVLAAPRARVFAVAISPEVGWFGK